MKNKFTIWLFGLVLLAAVVYLVEDIDIDTFGKAITLQGVTSWVVITLLMRVVQSEIIYLTGRSVGATASRVDIFWVNWARTFMNQVIPASGLAYYLDFMKRKQSVGWSAIASLALPQFFLAVTALLFLGALCAWLGQGIEGGFKSWITLLLFLAFVISWLAVLHFKSILAVLGVTKIRGRDISSLGFFEGKTKLFYMVFCLQLLAISMRMLRFYLVFLFAFSSVPFWNMALIAVMGEFGLLMQLTPGGIGLREAIMVSAGHVYQFDLSMLLSVVLVERALVIITTVCMMPPAVWYLRKYVH